MHALASVWSGLIPETCGLGFSSATGAGAGVEAAGAEAIGAGVETVAGAGVAAGVGAVASCAFCCCCPGTPILLIRSLPGSSHPAAMAGVRHKMTVNKKNFLSRLLLSDSQSSLCYVHTYFPNRSILST